MSEQAFAFVLMPFDEGFGDTYFLGIKETAAKLGILAERVDEQVFHSESILQRICRQIEIADFIIADMTGRNPNVFYEVGFAHAKEKTCVLLTKDPDDIPFDLKHHRHIVYSSISELNQKLGNDLSVVQQELKQKSDIITVTAMNPSGYLVKTKYTATAEVTLTFDIHNYTSEISPDILGIYFFTGKGWTYFQDGQECLHSDADPNLAGYTTRHFVKTPVPRLVKGGWAQVKLVGKKVVAWALNGEELKDSYALAGRALFSMATPRGNFDTTVNLHITVDEIPF